MRVSEEVPTPKKGTWTVSLTGLTGSTNPPEPSVLYPFTVLSLVSGDGLTITRPLKGRLYGFPFFLFIQITPTYIYLYLYRDAANALDAV